MSAIAGSSAFQILAELLRSRSGLAIGPDKLYLLETRLGSIIRREKLGDLAGLAQRLSAPAAETLAGEVVEAMTTNESFFFRDDKPFAHVRAKALPRLLLARPPGTPIRIWSAAASSGQEAYSLAIIAAELGASKRVEIVGTDIARAQLARAREGLYSQFEVQRGLPVQLLAKHFRKEEDQWRVAPPLREMVQFREWNLLADPGPLGRFDIVFCRNVLIYFDQPTKARVLEAIARQMAEDGLLYLGGTETVLGLTNQLVPLAEDRSVYSKVAAPPTSISSQPRASNRPVSPARSSTVVVSDSTIAGPCSA
ncbi:MAG TPA: protein-glutamate O-methyltransferase CheR [Acetobacteraceae bacterium]|jgi:chemotaxis protein methyltransferase CheR|nr:protein-glutamate O-methyltransferase CheR [Acetobacteraceae bacterium]